MSKLNASDLENMFASMLDSFDKGDVDKVKSVYPESILSEYKESLENSPAMFSRLMESHKNGILLTIMPKEQLSNHNLKLFYQHYDFIENNFKSVINMKEGMPCSADKSKWVMENLEHYLKTNEERNPDYSQDFTFHLPKKVLNDTQTIYSFFKALMQFYYGNSKEYFVLYHQLMIK